MIIPIPSRSNPPSPRARELSQKLHETIEQFERHYPGTSDSDIRQALELLEVGQVTERRPTAVVVGLLVALVVGLIVFYFFTAGEPSVPGQSPANTMWLVAGLTVVLGIMAVARSRRM